MIPENREKAKQNSAVEMSFQGYILSVHTWGALESHSALCFPQM